MVNQKNIEPRITLQSMKVLRTFMDNLNEELSGVDVRKATSLATGTLYPILLRFEQAGWLTSNWEKVDPSEAGRPRKRLYKIAAAGQRKANEVLLEFEGSQYV